MPPSVASPLLWIGFTIFILSMIVLDLAVFHRKAHEVRYREALIWTLVWISLALLCNGGVYLRFGHQRGLEFLTGYLIEYALSVDNIFIFLLIFRYFSVPTGLQHRVLFWGILGAMAMRLMFILAGITLLQSFEWIIFVFGAFVILAGVKMLQGEEVEVHPEHNLVLRLFRKVFPTAPQDGARLIVRRNGRICATPLLLVLVVVEATDVVFATDSIPAIFAITRDPFIAFTSNIFAILGLRSLYFLLAGAMNRFHYLKWGLGFVLVFVGIKMVISDYFVVPIGISLAVVGVLLGASVVVSFLRKPPPPSPRPRKAAAFPLPPWRRK
jgi:tellurite resistance protein TerC